MEKQVKKEVLIGFLQDIKTIMEKVENNTATARDYQLMQEYFELAEVDQSIIDGMVSDCFSNWVKFYEERQKPLEQQNLMEVKATLGRIKGVGRAATENVVRELQRPEE